MDKKRGLFRYDVRRDKNEPIIVEALRELGCSVTYLSGAGLPDLLVGYNGVTMLFEVKNTTNLTKSQKAWHKKWTGHVKIVRDPEDAIVDVQNHFARFH